MTLTVVRYQNRKHTAWAIALGTFPRNFKFLGLQEVGKTLVKGQKCTKIGL